MWEKTVMTRKRAMKLWGSGNLLGDSNLAIARAQAEISYKAGYDEACDAEGWCDGYTKGIKEVVEWIDKNNELNDEPWGVDYDTAYGYDPMEEGDVVLKAEDWETQKKEWGIKEAK